MTSGSLTPAPFQDWWTDLWLNEGYASFVEHMCVEHLFPEYDIWSQFVPDVLLSALSELRRSLGILRFAFSETSRKKSPGRFGA